MKRAIIYVPGLGDHRARGQQVAMATWQLYGVKTKVMMGWRTKEPYGEKLARLVGAIDSFQQQGYIVSLVGVSAGASAVVNAYAQRADTVHKVVCICGKLRNPQTISPRTYSQNPAFAESLAMLPLSIAALSLASRRNILSIRPLSDSSVPPADTLIPDAQSRVIATRGHIASIAAAITIYSFSIVRFLRR